MSSSPPKMPVQGSQHVSCGSELSALVDIVTWVNPDNVENSTFSISDQPATLAESCRDDPFVFGNRGRNVFFQAIAFDCFVTLLLATRSSNVTPTKLAPFVNLFNQIEFVFLLAVTNPKVSVSVAKREDRPKAVCRRRHSQSGLYSLGSLELSTFYVSH